jgi:enoyl-[acyl-carrier protein] reductase I
MIDSAPLMAGKKGLIMGVANERSIAWAIARAAHAQGAELAFTYQGEALQKRVQPLAASVGSEIVLPCDVTDMASIDAVFETLKQGWGKLDFVFTPSPTPTRRSEGKNLNTTTRTTSRAPCRSVFSFTRGLPAGRRPDAGRRRALTLTYLGADG